MHMKHNLIRRLTAFLLSLLLLGVTVNAADNAQQIMPPWLQWRAEPSWNEFPVQCQSGANTLRGTLTLPKNVEGQLPMAILLHGLNTDQNWCADMAWHLASNGIASVRFDFAGTGTSDGAQEEMTVSTQVQDTLSILEYVQCFHFTDCDNIFLVGKSMGAVDAILATETCASEIRALCLWYPGFGVTAFANHGYLLGVEFDPENLPDTLQVENYTYGSGFLKEAMEINCRTVMARFDKPVLILHGDQDGIAPIGFSYGATSIFPNCTLKVIEGGGHGFWGPQEIGALWAMEKFLKSNL